MSVPIWQNRKIRIGVVISLLVLPFFIIFIATRSFILVPITAQILQDKYGATVKIDSASWSWDGVLTLENVVLQANDVKGPASKVFTIKNSIITFNSWLPLFNQEIISVEFDEALIRLAESKDNSGIFNVTNLISQDHSQKTTSTTNQSPPTSKQGLPIIELNKVSVETGSFGSDGSWELEGSRVFVLDQMTNDVELLTFSFHDQEEDFPIVATYSNSTETLAVTFEKIKLSHSIFELLPKTARTWCDETNLEGSIEMLQVNWQPQEGIEIIADVKDVTLLLPQEHGIPWVLFNERMTTPLRGVSVLDVDEGRIVFNGKSLLLEDFQGDLQSPSELVESLPIPFRADIEISEFPSRGNLQNSEWMPAMLSSAPFHAKFYIDQFADIESKYKSVIIPKPVAQMLSIFQLKGWKVNAQVEIVREELGSEIRVRGDLKIDGESGKFKGFPYPLKDVKSLISFDQDVFSINSLTAHGSNDAKVRIAGQVIANDDELVVDIELHVDDAPLDEHLRGAVSKPIASLMSRLMDSEIYDEISERNQFPQYQSFDLGGEIDLDLILRHDSNEGGRVEIFGEVAFDDIGIISSAFPYPVRLKDGRVELDPSGIWIPEGQHITVEGAGFGVGDLDGRIHFQDEGTAIPQLVLKIKNEKVNPALIEAISMSAGESYESSLNVLAGLGLEARLLIEGKIYGDDKGEINIEFKVNIENATATPNDQFAKAIQASGPYWPQGFQFTDIKAEVEILNGAVTMSNSTCRCGDGSITTSMKSDKSKFELDIRGTNLPLTKQFVYVLPTSASERLAPSWNWLEPTGTVDIVMRLDKEGNNSDLHMELVPTEITVSSAGQTVKLIPFSDTLRASIVVENSNIFLNNLEFQLHQGENPQGLLQISGEVHGDLQELEYAIESTWKEASIKSPLARAITGMAGGQAGVDYFDSINPDGFATASLVARGDAETIEYNIEVVPSMLSATFHKRQANATFHTQVDENTNKIVFDNKGIRFIKVHGDLGEGEFEINGSIRHTDGINGRFDLEWEGPSNDENLFAVLPSAVGDTLDAVSLSGGTSELPDGILSFKGDQLKDLRVSFAGDIFLHEVSMDVGIPLTEIDGLIHVFGEFDDDQLSDFHLELDIDQMTALGRYVKKVEGRIVLDEDGEKIKIDSLRGESNNGSVTVEGWLAVDESKEYEVTVLVSGVELASAQSEDALATLQGNLNGWISIAGIQKKTASRTGAGHLRFQNGYLEVDPLSLTAMHLLQLALPSATSITGAEITLYIDEDRIVLDHIVLTSDEEEVPDLVLEGEGVMDLDSFQMHARLHPRVGWPVIRDIAGVFSDQLYSIDVTGELLNPTISIVPLPFLSPHKD